MKSSVLYFGLTFAVVFFTIRIFAATPTAPSDSFYDQIVTLYAQASKIPDVDRFQGIWKGKCYPRTPSTDRRTAVLDVEAFIKHWHWEPPKDSPLKPIDANKFQIRPLGSDPEADWTSFLSYAGNLGSFEEYTEEHVSPNTWGKLFTQRELQTAQEAQVKQDQGYIYVWLRATTNDHWACYLSFDYLP
ncbi:MAG: hypothetical protein ACXWQE_05735 [Bdellovibrionales bacterium]